MARTRYTVLDAVLCLVRPWLDAIRAEFAPRAKRARVSALVLVVPVDVKPEPVAVVPEIVPPVITIRPEVVPVITIDPEQDATAPTASKAARSRKAGKPAGKATGKAKPRAMVGAARVTHRPTAKTVAKRASKPKAPKPKGGKATASKRKPAAK